MRDAPGWLTRARSRKAGRSRSLAFAAPVPNDSAKVFRAFIERQERWVAL
jgi:hypothetical protein